jgi:hypothetical protein
MEEVARQDRSFALSLFEDSHWSGNGFWSAVSGYAAGAGPGTDWRQLQVELNEIARARVTATTSKDDLEKQIASQLAHTDQLIANAWARHDLGDAMRFYIEESNATNLNSTPQALAMNILRAVPRDDRWEVVDWFAANRGEYAWIDEALVSYTHSLRYEPADDVIAELVSRPEQEGHRVRMLESLVYPRPVKGELRLPKSPEDTQRLIEAAHLSAEARA